MAGSAATGHSAAMGSARHGGRDRHPERAQQARHRTGDAARGEWPFDPKVRQHSVLDPLQHVKNLNARVSDLGRPGPPGINGSPGFPGSKGEKGERGLDGERCFPALQSILLG